MPLLGSEQRVSLHLKAHGQSTAPLPLLSRWEAKHTGAAGCTPRNVSAGMDGNASEGTVVMGLPGTIGTANDVVLLGRRVALELHGGSAGGGLVGLGRSNQRGSPHPASARTPGPSPAPITATPRGRCCSSTSPTARPSRASGGGTGR